MEDKIISAFDNLTSEQTARLLDSNMRMKIDGKTRFRIKKSVFEKAGIKKKIGIYIPRKFVACAASLVIIFTSVSIMGFDNVAASIGKLFNLIPGVGIVEKSESDVYIYEPIVKQISAQSSKANIVSAVYSKDYMTVTVEVLGKEALYDNFALYINRELRDYASDNAYSLGVTSDSSILTFSVQIDTPTSDDLFEIEISGFSEKLSFKMLPCTDFDEISKIGATDIQNGISLTAKAQREENQLLVWCYPFKATNKTEDCIMGYGVPANAAYNNLRYIETESGKIFESHDGWDIAGRMIFDVTEKNQTAVLHVPYLSMLREEKEKLRVDLPEIYSTAACDTAIECSLGTIWVTEIKREANQYEEDKDTVWLKLRFDSKEDGMLFNSFDYASNGKSSSCAKHFNGENGCLEYLEVNVDKNESKISLDITNLYYYLLGDYVIPLDIQ